jgi:hypothetical protein
LEVLETLAARAWLTGRVSAAALVRKVDAERPTLLLDESDAAFAGPSEYAEALRGVLNTGYRASGKATVCVGQGTDIVARDFVTFCPKAIAGLGKLPDTVRSRSIPIRLKRRRDDEPISPWLTSEPPPEAAKLHARLAAWGEAHVQPLRARRPERPDGLRDRAFDVWRPLLAIADDAGEEWAEEARAAAATLSGAGRADAPTSHGTTLLAKLRELFADADQLSTATILAAVNEDDELPFGAWRDGEGLAPHALAKLLRPYGVRPLAIWVVDHTVRGYRREDFKDSFARYLAKPSARSARTPSQSQESAESQVQGDPDPCTSEPAENPDGDRDLADLADSDAGIGVHEDDDGQLAMVNGRPTPGLPPPDWKPYVVPGAPADEDEDERERYP